MPPETKSHKYQLLPLSRHNFRCAVLQPLLSIMQFRRGCFLQINRSRLQHTAANCQAYKQQPQASRRPFRQLQMKQLGDHHHTQRHDGPVRAIFQIFIFAEHARPQQIHRQRPHPNRSSTQTRHDQQHTAGDSKGTDDAVKAKAGIQHLQIEQASEGCPAGLDLD